MSLSTVEKSNVIKKHQRSSQDVGSPEVQVSLFTARIQYLTEHLKIHKKDLHSKRGLQLLVAKRRKLLDYLKRINLDAYQALLATLNLRR